MTDIKVKYDAQSRTFKLANEAFVSFLENNVEYNLTLPFRVEEAEQDWFTCVETTWRDPAQRADNSFAFHSVSGEDGAARSSMRQQRKVLT